MFVTTSFESITKSLRVIADKLIKLADDNRFKVNQLNEEITERRTKIKTLDDEGTKATRTADKLRELLGEPKSTN